MISPSRAAIGTLIIAMLLAGCSKGVSQGGSPPGQPQSTFPVYSPSTVFTVGKYDDSIDVTKFGSSFFGEGPDTYKPFIGSQELIKTGASMEQLDTWLVALLKSPPQDLAPDQAAVQAPSSAAKDNPFRVSLKMFGLVPSEYWAKDRSRVVTLIVFDPKKVADHMGPAIEVLDQYDKVPAIFRGALDATLKKQVGLSVSDLTDPSTPMGMIVYAARNWRSEDTRAIVLIDAARQNYTLPTPHDT
ncbi:MAG TPA: hypothetical protein VID19_13575 [Candidatus Eremiobacteraceae bacterium]|jgi:hypothetical protein